MADSSITIGSAFSFSERDYQENQKGTLSIDQRAILATHIRGRGCGTRAASLSIGLTAALIPGVFFLVTDPGSPGFRQALPFIVGTCSAFLLIFVFFVFLSRLRSRDLRNSYLSTAEGESRVWKKEYNHGTAFLAKVGGVKFQLHSPEQMEALSRHSFYRIHYVKNPPVHIILSLAPLG